MKALQNTKIRRFLTCFLFLGILIPSLIAMVFAYSFIRGTIEKQYTRNYIESIFSEIESGFAIMVFQLNNIYIHLMNSREIGEITVDPQLNHEQKYEKLEEIFQILLAHDSVVSIIDFVDVNGELYRFGNSRADFAAPSSAYLSSLSKTQLLFSDNYVKCDGKAYNMLGRKLFNFNNGVEFGDIIFYIDGNKLASLYTASEDSESLFFVASDDIIIFHPDNRYIGSQIYVPAELFDWFYYRLYRNSDYIFSEYNLENSSILNKLTITCIMSNHEMFQKMNQTLRYFWISYILVALLSLVISIRLSSKLLKQLSNLKYNMEHFKLDHPLQKVSRSSNEIAVLEISFQKMAEKIRNLVEAIDQEKEKQRMAELNALQSQINPHFIYNALDAISWKAKENQQWEIDDMLVTLATFFRTGLHKGDHTIRISEELEHVKSYLSIELVRFPELFSVSYDIDETTLECMTLKIILQPIVENSIKHGFKGIIEGGKIHIRNYRAGEDIIFEVADNGCGTVISADKLLQNDPAQGGYGLYNVNERLMQYYGKNYGLRIESSPGKGTLVQVRIKATP